jgi:hypothetical protein
LFKSDASIMQPERQTWRCTGVDFQANVEPSISLMPQFADVLSQVQATAELAELAAKSVRVNTTGWDHWITSEISDDAAPSLRPGAEYLDEPPFPSASEPQFRPKPAPQPAAPPPPQAQPEPVPEPEPPLDLKAELAQQRLQSMSLHELRALRRRLARRVHPDIPARQRVPDPGAMAKVNVEIDAAIKARLHRR